MFFGYHMRSKYILHRHGASILTHADNVNYLISEQLVMECWDAECGATLKFATFSTPHPKATRKRMKCMRILFAW